MNNYLNSKLALCLIPFMFSANAQNIKSTEIKSLVEFFSFTCSHCANINTKLNQYVADHKIKYLDINIDNNPQAVDTNIMYYIAIDAGVGEQFKQTYFKAVSSGMEAYSPSTLLYVTTQVQNATMKRLMRSTVEQEHIKQKLNYTLDLINTYHIQATPTFLINQTTLLEGEDIINSLIEADHG